MQRFKITDYFTLVELQTSKGLVFGLKLLKPEKWKNLVFTFGDIKPFDALHAMRAKIPVEVDFRFLDNPNNISDEDLNSPEFDDLVQDIFRHVMHEVS